MAVPRKIPVNPDVFGPLINQADGDEEDGFDETILPLDYEAKGQITDDVRC